MTQFMFFHWMGILVRHPATQEWMISQQIWNFNTIILILNSFETWSSLQKKNMRMRSYISCRKPFGVNPISSWVKGTWIDSVSMLNIAQSQLWTSHSKAVQPHKYMKVRSFQLNFECNSQGCDRNVPYVKHTPYSIYLPKNSSPHVCARGLALQMRLKRDTAIEYSCRMSVCSTRMLSHGQNSLRIRAIIIISVNYISVRPHRLPYLLS